VARACGGPDKRYYPRVALYLLKLGVFEPARRLERRRLPPVGPLPHPPTFILGYYRSGTTHLQEVLLQDPRFAYMNFYQGFFSTAFNLTESWVKPVFEQIITRTGFLHPAHQIPFSFHLPAEEDIAMVSHAFDLASNWGQIYQRHFKRIYGKTALLQNISDAEYARFSAMLEDLIWRVSLANDHQPLLLKSPPHTGRLRLLRDLYPDAKFIFIRRHPYDVYQSNLKLWKSFEENRLQVGDDAAIPDNILWSHDLAHQNYEADKVGLADDQLVEVGFEDFAAAPLDVLERIYTTLELVPFPKQRFASYLRENHAPGQPYPVTEAERAMIDRRLGHWMEAWGYASERRRRWA
jgi:hypothetical protein